MVTESVHPLCPRVHIFRASPLSGAHFVTGHHTSCVSEGMKWLPLLTAVSRKMGIANFNLCFSSIFEKNKRMIRRETDRTQLAPKKSTSHDLAE